MLPVNSQTVIATVRTATIYLWTYLSGLLLVWLGAFEGSPEFVASIGDFLTGPEAVLFVGTAIYAALYKAAQWDNIVGKILGFVFIFPQQPTYEVPTDTTNV